VVEGQEGGGHRFRGLLGGAGAGRDGGLEASADGGLSCMGISRC